MSGTLRNTLRLIGTSKYVPNNSTKYVRSIMLMAGRTNNSLSLLQPNYLNNNKFKKLQSTQERKISTDIVSTIKAVKETIKAKWNNDEFRTSHVKDLDVTVSSTKLKINTGLRRKNLLLPLAFTTEFNGRLIKPEIKGDSSRNNKSFDMGKWNVSLNDDKLTLKVKDSDETFILKHAIDVKVHVTPPETLPDGGIKEFCSEMVFTKKFIHYPAEVISSTEETGPLSRKFPPLPTGGPETNQNSESTKDHNDKITDTPNRFGRMKLKFPMTASLKGPSGTNLFENTRDFASYSHTVEIRAFKDKSHETADKNKKKTSKPGKLQMRLFSDLFLQSKVDLSRSVLLAFSVDIEIDLESEVPSILIMPDTFTRAF